MILHLIKSIRSIHGFEDEFVWNKQIESNCLNHAWSMANSKNVYNSPNEFREGYGEEITTVEYTYNLLSDIKEGVNKLLKIESSYKHLLEWNEIGGSLVLKDNIIYIVIRGR